MHCHAQTLFRTYSFPFTCLLLFWLYVRQECRCIATLQEGRWRYRILLLPSHLDECGLEQLASTVTEY